MVSMMEISEKYFGKYPGLEEILIEISSSIKALKICRVEKVYPNEIGKPLRHLIPFRFLVYLLALLNRVINIRKYYYFN